MRRFISIPQVELALWSICAGLGGYLIVSSALEGRWGKALFIAALAGALAWAIRESNFKR